MTEVFLGFGSNLGDKAANIRLAAAWIADHERIQNFRLSSLYRTAPVGVVDQDWFVNAAARCQTDLEPRTLLAVCLEAERRLKRVRRVRWGPRTLDVDILVFGDLRMEEPDLEIPHPRLHERAFVLAPLAELNPNLVVAGRTARDWLDACGVQGVERLGDEPN